MGRFIGYWSSINSNCTWIIKLQDNLIKTVNLPCFNALVFARGNLETKTPSGPPSPRGRGLVYLSLVVSPRLCSSTTHPSFGIRISVTLENQFQHIAWLTRRWAPCCCSSCYLPVSNISTYMYFKEWESTTQRRGVLQSVLWFSFNTAVAEMSGQ